MNASETACSYRLLDSLFKNAGVIPFEKLSGVLRDGESSLASSRFYSSEFTSFYANARRVAKHPTQRSPDKLLTGSLARDFSTFFVSVYLCKGKGSSGSDDRGYYFGLVSVILKSLKYASIRLA